MRVRIQSPTKEALPALEDREHRGVGDLLGHFAAFQLLTSSLLHSFTSSLLHSFTPSLLHSFTSSLLHFFTPSLLHFFTLSDPADVAKDGYEALMSGKDKVVSGFKNKVMVTLGNITPDTLQAEQMKEMQRPAEEKRDE